MFDFNKISEEELNLTPELILNKVKQDEIFRFYFPSFEIGKVLHSPFRSDKKPSFGFYEGKHYIKAKDFSKDQEWNCFAFVQELFHLSFPEALTMIYKDLKLYRLQGSKLELPKYHVKKDKKIIKINNIPFTNNIINYYEQYGISYSDIIYNDAYNFDSYSIVNKTKKEFKKIKTISNLRTAFLVEDDGKYYFKIYQPYSKYKWINNIPVTILFGEKNLPYISDTLIITKSWKDMVILRRYFTDVIATQNESLSAVKEVEKLDYKNKIIFYDNDEPGLEAAKAIKEKYNYDYVISNDLKSKDISDYYVNNGKEQTNKFINEIKRRIEK